MIAAHSSSGVKQFLTSSEDRPRKNYDLSRSVLEERKKELWLSEVSLKFLEAREEYTTTLRKVSVV